jgi:hypothetical protein
MEPEWTKQIPSSFICDWFYVFFFIYASLFTLALVVLVWLMFTLKKGGISLLGQVVYVGVMGVFASTTVLFYYLMCDRALLNKKE